MPGTPSLPTLAHTLPPRPHSKSPRGHCPHPWNKEKWDLKHRQDREVVKKRPGGGWGKVPEIEKSPRSLMPDHRRGLPGSHGHL